MEGYYKEVLEEIRDLINDGSYEEAAFLVKKEMKMPYIPQDVEKELRIFQKEIRYEASLRKQHGEIPFDELLYGLLHGREKKQLFYAEALSKHNLRSCIDELQEYLEKDPFEEAAALLIEAIAEQEIDEEFVYNKGGVEYTFFGDEVTPVIKNAAFLECYRKLEDVLCKNPSLCNLARSILVHDAMMQLPISIDEMEVDSIVKQVALTACKYMDDEASARMVNSYFE